MKGAKVAYLDRDQDVQWTRAGEAMLSEETRNLIEAVAGGVS